MPERKAQQRETTHPNQANQASEKRLTLDDLRDLRALRDDLRRKIHLGRQSARDRFQQLEDQWSELQRKLPDAETLEANFDYAKLILYALGRRVVVDLSAGYQRLRDDLELGRDSDSGGQTRNVVELARSFGESSNGPLRSARRDIHRRR